MKTAMSLLIVAATGIAAFFLSPAAYAYDQNDFSAVGRMYQPPPEGHVVGKDNGPGSGLHHSGEECGKCHNMGGKAENHLWTVSGTLYADRSGRSVLKGGEIILQDIDGNVISLTSNEVGNFWSTTPIASNPLTVSAHGNTLDILYELDADGNLVEPADPTDPRTWLYKAWVKKGASARPMLTIAPLAGSSGMNMSCSMHHSGMGSRGALWVSHEPALSSYPETDLSYHQHIQPILRSKCAPCHIPGRSMTRLVTKTDIEPPSTSFDFSSGLDLMTYAGSPADAVSKRGISSVLNTAEPDSSLLLRKTVPNATHGGGSFWNERDPDYQAIKRWITEGGGEN